MVCWDYSFQGEYGSNKLRTAMYANKASTCLLAENDEARKETTGNGLTKSALGRCHGRKYSQETIQKYDATARLNYDFRPADAGLVGRLGGGMRYVATHKKGIPLKSGMPFLSNSTVSTRYRDVLILFFVVFTSGAGEAAAAASF